MFVKISGISTGLGGNMLEGFKLKEEEIPILLADW
jgi:hypothetical protein